MAPTDYAHQFNPGFALDPRTVALVVVDMQYASGSRDDGLGRRSGAGPRGARRLPLRPHRADRGPDHPAAARVLSRAPAARGLPHRRLGAARLLRPAAPHARASPRAPATPRAATSTRSSTRSRRAPARPSQQDDHERVSLLGLRAAGARLGVEQLLFTGSRPTPASRAPRATPPTAASAACSSRTAAARQPALHDAPARTSPACSAAWRRARGAGRAGARPACLIQVDASGTSPEGRRPGAGKVAG